MIAEYTNSKVLAEPFGEPHFDEEATLLSARPVVPLTEVKSKEHRQRFALLAVTLTLAVLVGALGATWFYSNRDETRIKTATLIDAEVGIAADVALPQDEIDLIPNAVASEISPEAVAEFEAQPAENSAKTGRKTPTKPSREREVKRTEQGASQAVVTPEPTPIPVAPNEARWEERRERREARRQRRAARQSGRDLFRIHEIFEGSPRP